MIKRFYKQVGTFLVYDCSVGSGLYIIKCLKDLSLLSTIYFRQHGYKPYCVYFLHGKTYLLFLEVLSVNSSCVNGI